MKDTTIKCAFKKMVPIVELRPHPRNPNVHPQRQIEALAKIIRHQGWRAPIVVSKLSGRIVAGHGRLEAAKALGLTHAPVDYQSFDTEADELAHLIADNRIAELADMDDALVAAILDQDLRGILDLDIAGIVESVTTEEPAEVRQLEVKPAPKMTWVIIGIPTVKFGTIAAQVETIAANPETVVESSLTD